MRRGTDRAREPVDPRPAGERLGPEGSGARMFERDEVARELEARGFVDVRRA